MQSPIRVNFADALRAIETQLNVRYPPDALDLLRALAQIVGTTQYQSVFKNARLILSADDVLGACDEAGEPIFEARGLPFIRVDHRQPDDQTFADYYFFDTADPTYKRISVFAIHTIVQTWVDKDLFFEWVRTFLRPDTIGS